MSQVSIVDIADKVTELLNAQKFAQPFNAERQYVPTFELTEMNRVRVTVVPQERSRETDGKSTDRVERKIIIAVQKRFDRPVTEVDDLVRLVEEIEDFLCHEDQRTLDVKGSQVFWDGSEVDRLYSPSQLRQLNQFTSGIVLTYWALTDVEN